MDYYYYDDYFVRCSGVTSKQLILKYLKDKNKDINWYDVIPERYKMPNYVLTSLNTKALRDVVK